MHLSAPLHRLKREARLLSRQQTIPLHVALDRIAAREGFRSWSLLAHQVAAVSPAARLFARLSHGDLLLVGARPGEGKTLLALELGVEAMKAGGRCVLFTLEYVERDVAARFDALGADVGGFGGRFQLDASDDICAARIIGRLAAMPSGTLAVVDYLQILDQDRAKPPLGELVRALAAFARTSGTILVVLSQIDRRFESSRKALPDLADVRRPNPVDLSAFSRTVFLNAGTVAVAPS